MTWVQSKFTDFAVPPSKKQKIESSNESTNESFNTQKPSGSKTPLPPTRTWKPRCKSDLVVNKKKIDEVDSWLVLCKRKHNSRILLITGPPGCGKLTTLKVLCAEHKINLVEWLPQIAQRKYDPESGEFCQSISSQFEEFVSRATRYTNVLTASAHRLIVVKDIPNCYLRDNGSFHELLNKYSQISDVYLSFILTDVPVVRGLFPDHIKSAFNVTSVALNPVTQRGVKDVLKKVFQNKFPNFVDNVSVLCNGDLRNAITTFEFGANPVVIKKSKTVDSKAPKSDFLDLFRGLGRILYCKRDDDGKLVHDPVGIGESFISSPDLFYGMLHENYLNTYSSVHDIAKASEILSNNETILTDFKDCIASRTISLVVSSYGVMTSNTVPFKKFQQLNKARKIDNSLLEFRSKFSDTNVLLDFAFYGRQIPSFAQENSDFLRKVNELK